MSRPILVPILGDQLSRNLASLRGRAKHDTVILMMEVWDEATYVKHHKQKIALILSAMRHFAAELREAGWNVDYVKLTDEGKSAIEEYRKTLRPELAEALPHLFHPVLKIILPVYDAALLFPV